MSWVCSQFVLNAPEEELQSFQTILFYVEQAHWFYEDYTMEQNQHIKSLTLREFTSLCIL
jgi:mRNA-decapping enzyme subunit 2